jgi:thioredoxin reductase
MNTKVDYLIIGAGPAGLQLAYFFEKNQRDYLILDKGSKAGNFFNEYPRHRTLISINKVYTGTDNKDENMRWDWNSLVSDSDDLLFKNYSKRYFPPADVILDYLDDYAQHYNLNIKYNTTVTNVSKKEGEFILTDSEGNEYNGKRLIVATGVSKEYKPGIPGIELCETYATHSIDPEDYVNKRVMIVGKGNSAFETADHLTETAAVIHICSPESIEFAWQTHYVGNLRAVNNNFLDTYQLKSQNAVIDASIRKIEKHNGKYMAHIDYSHAKGQSAVIEYDHIIFCTGFMFDSSIFDDSCQPASMMMGKLPTQTSEWESVNVPDLYFAGTLMAACDFHKTMSGFIHGFRHNIETLAHVLEQKYHDNPWPSDQLEKTPQAVVDKIIKRVTTAPAIFLQPGFLGDVFVVDDENNTVAYHPDVRMDFVPESQFSKNDHYYTVSLEYGHFDGDPFSVDRDPDPDKGDEAPYLHPIIRRFKQGMPVTEHHINDDLENAWHKEIYTKPAIEFFEEQLN